MKINYDGTGWHEIECNIGTMSIYEQEFHSSILADVFGKIELSDSDTEIVTADFVSDKLTDANGGELPKVTQELIEKAFPTEIVTKVDFTKDNWENYIKALWAMLKTYDYLHHVNELPPFKEWVFSISGDIDMRELSFIVTDLCQKRLFRHGVTTLSD